MSGIEIIEWAVRKCREDGVPPSDSAIVRMIRYRLIDVNDAKVRAKEQQKELRAESKPHVTDVL